MEKFYKSKFGQKNQNGTLKAVGCQRCQTSGNSCSQTPNVMPCIPLHFVGRVKSGGACSLKRAWSLYTNTQDCILVWSRQSHHQRTEVWLNRALSLFYEINGCLLLLISTNVLSLIWSTFPHINIEY